MIRTGVCPICHLGREDSGGRGLSCKGFVSDDRRYAHCQRVPVDGREPHGTPEVWSHLLDDGCECGESHRDSRSDPADGSHRTRRSENPQPNRHEVESYQYRDASGTLRFEVVRYDPKDFSMRDAAGVPNLKSVAPEHRHLPFILPEVYAAIAAGTRCVYIAEGERDVLSLVACDLIATCNAGGALKWRWEHVGHLVMACAAAGIDPSDVEVVVWIDNDTKGAQHGTGVRDLLEPVGFTVRIVRSPHEKDAAAHLGAHHALEDVEIVDEATLEELARESSPKTSRPDADAQKQAGDDESASPASGTSSGKRSTSERQGTGKNDAPVFRDLPPITEADVRGMTAPDGSSLVVPFYDPTIQYPNDAPNEQREFDWKLASDDTNLEDVAFLVPGLYPLSEFSILAGISGIGKSQTLMPIVAGVTTGRACTFYECTFPPGRVVYASFEESRKTIFRRALAAGADPNRLVILDSEFLSIGLGEDRERIVRAIDQMGDVVLVIIDPLNGMMGGGRSKVDMSSDADVRGALFPLAVELRNRGITTIGVVHLNRNTEANVQNRILGGGSTTAMARGSAVIGYDPLTMKRVLTQLKVNESEPVPSWLVEISTTYVAMRKRDGRIEGIKTSRAVSPGRSQLTRDDLIYDPPSASGRDTKYASKKQREARDSGALQWLRKKLGEAPDHCRLMMNLFTEASTETPFKPEVLRAAFEASDAEIVREINDSGQEFWSLGSAQLRTTDEQPQRKSPGRKKDEAPNEATRGAAISDLLDAISRAQDAGDAIARSRAVRILMRSAGTGEHYMTRNYAETLIADERSRGGHARFHVTSRRDAGFKGSGEIVRIGPEPNPDDDPNNGRSVNGKNSGAGSPTNSAASDPPVSEAEMGKDGPDTSRRERAPDHRDESRGKAGDWSAEATGAWESPTSISGGALC